MSNVSNEQFCLPDPASFLEWVKRAMNVLGKKPSHFLLDEGAPGSKNRVSRLLDNPNSIKLTDATRLQNEILGEAKRQRIDVGLPVIEQVFLAHK